MACDEKDCPTSVHGSEEVYAGGIPCRLLTCEKPFTPRRKNQVFCTAECREEYYIKARNMGVAALEVLRREKAIENLTDEEVTREAIRVLNKDEKNGLNDKE
jgi:hypothetical protein